MTEINYPKSSEGELDEMYEKIDVRLKIIDEVLRKNLEIEGEGDHEVVRFDTGGEMAYLRSMDEEPDVMVELFQKLSGFSDREFERQYGISAIGQRLSGRKTSFITEDDAVMFAKILQRKMTWMHLRDVKITYAKMRENDQRRFERMQYEVTVREDLRDAGFPVVKGSGIEGEPDLVIPDSEPFDVVGEVRVYHAKDMRKRHKEFRQEAREAKERWPDAKYIVVANPGNRVLTEDREAHREKIDAPEVDQIVFHDEMDEFFELLEEWGVEKAV